jgi:hypothetical protein
MVFDGKSVFVGRQLPTREPTDRGEVFLLNIAGPGPLELPSEPMAWGEYQAWVDGLRARRYELTTQRFTPCGREV